VAQRDDSQVMPTAACLMDSVWRSGGGSLVSGCSSVGKIRLAV